MLTLHDYPASANCFKVRMLLSQLGRPYERVHVDIFAGDSQTDAYLALNPAGRTPLLVTEAGDPIPESGAILLYLAEGTPFLPDDPVERAHVHAWMFFEQNLLEPNVGTARFWRLTGRDGERPEAFARHLEAGAAALAVLERGLEGREFLVGGRYTVADCALYAYTRVAHEAGYDMTAFPAVGAWLRRVAATPGAVDDLGPYPATARAGAGGRSAHDRSPGGAQG
jgi:glutathione S-transferase